MRTDAAIIAYALSQDDPINLLDLWMHGQFDEIKALHPDIPDELLTYKVKCKPPETALTEWASHADDPSLSAIAREAHLKGHSYIMNCTFVAPTVKSTVPMFYSRDMSGMFMVALDGYTIAPNYRVVILPEDVELAARMKQACFVMEYGVGVPG